MPKFTQTDNHVTDPAILEKALMLACERIADSSQTYEEANTAEGWRDVLIRRAESEHEGTLLKM